MGIVIRKAKNKDAAAISRLIRNTINKVNSEHYPKKQLESELACYTRTKIEEYLSDKKRLMFCLTDRGKIIGVAMLDKKNKTLESLYLVPRCIGKGYGRFLMDFMEKKAKQLKIRNLTLYPTDYAYNFYKKMGYGKIRTFMGTHNGGFPVTEMRKRL